MSDTRFRPVRGTDEKIQNAQYSEGYVYFATDTGKIYLDSEGKRISLGGGGASVLYGQAPSDLEPDEFGLYYLEVSTLESAIVPKVGDLIINTDGAFYRILEVNEDTGIMTCTKVAVSGTGGGGGDLSRAISLRFGSTSLNTRTLINGQALSIPITATSAMDTAGEYLDEYLSVEWSFYQDNVRYANGFLTLKSGETFDWEFGTSLRHNATTNIRFQATGTNSGQTKIYDTLNIMTVTMELTQTDKFTPNVLFTKGIVNMECSVSGALNKLLEYFIDDNLLKSVELSDKTIGKQSYQATGVSHGIHTAKIQLTQILDDGSRGTTIEPIEFEIIVTNDGYTEPIIWLGDYKDLYYSYDPIKIPFKVYNPVSTTTTVKFFNGAQELSERVMENEVQGIFEIVDGQIGILNTYFIRIPDSDIFREISFDMEEDTTRENFKIQRENDLIVNFSAAGRSNNESIVNRQICQLGDYYATFKNFNWYNNGWILDDDNNTCLRISNGAEFSVPIGSLHANTAENPSCAFEFQFKVRNVQDYSTLIKEITRYANDTEYWNAFNDPEQNIEGIESYDQFLQWYCERNDLDYEQITAVFDKVEKVINLSAPFCKYYNDLNRIGLCLGPQDGFFTTGKSTISVKYVEDKLTNLTIVLNRTDKRIYIYLNGVLAGVSNIGSEKVDITTDAIVFNSLYCDLDLYKFRIYKNALDVAEIDINYAVDLKETLMFDHVNQLVQYDTNLQEYQFSYDAMLEFNRNNPDDHLAPYIIFEPESGVNLPYSKANDIVLKSVEFVNVGLDRAYQTGELDYLAAQEGYIDEPDGMTAAQQYYFHHCPSFIATNPELSVQGTSSEFYPRRNYKMKLKDATSFAMHKGPFAESYGTDPSSTTIDTFYMNNDTVGTDKFTLKVDYMESSGTYNMGMANLVATAYTKHPLNDYNKANAFSKEITSYEISNEPFNPDETYFEDAEGEVEASVDSGSYQTGTYYVEKITYEPYQFENLQDYRTSVKGFPTFAFWKKSDTEILFIGRYNMLLDKGSDECYGFKPDKDIVANFLNHERVRDMTECWEYSNNNRTYCSFRDPQNRKELDFLAYDDDSQLITNSKGTAPIVTDSFEYRYSQHEDMLDYIYDPTSFSTSDYEDLIKDYGDYGDLTDLTVRANIIKDTYSNLEKVSKWLWSTCVDTVPSLGTYKLVDLAEALYEADVYYIYNGNEYVKAIEEEFDPQQTYYRNLDGETIELTDDPSLVYTPGVYYTKIGDNYILDSIEEEGNPPTFDPEKDYYKLEEDPESQAEDLEEPVEYGGKTYYKDTKEYRLAKFKAEFNKHLDLEYCLVYFVMTEVFLCYDSRGKNCMLGSWGPLEEGGDYIWYPMFYDIDTQLGINNTGIPSFEYYVDASIDGCFSTADSVLWQNLYTCFFENIRAKYHELRHSFDNINLGQRVEGPISSVEHIENWYLAKPEETGELNMRGSRPLIALNMDEFYKYISICNPKIGYQSRNGDIIVDSGTFFYALQGDRSLSRQQFLARRINFVDSWLSDGEYSRSEGTDIHGRISANNPKVNSDKWIEGNATNGVAEIIPNTEYYQKTPEGEIIYDDRGWPKKTNYLDGDVFVALTPYQRSYVTIGDDNESFDSKPYERTAVRFDFPSTLTNGLKTSGGYSEQLFYIYGASSLKDIGDVSRLYWTEFYAKNSPKLSRILIGNDNPEFYNKGLKMPDFDADLKNKGKPLLKEVNLTNVTIDNGDSSVTFDFSSSEKMEIFKAIGSNIEAVTFADGVALNTLYLPNTITTLTLTEANNLTNILTEKPTSEYAESTDIWTSPKGFYLAGITDGTADSSQLSYIKLEGGALGYDSYKVLHKLYELHTNSDLRITMTKVDWSPYKKLAEGYQYVNSEQYYADDGHYGFKAYEYNPQTWDRDIINGEIYRYDASPVAPSIDLQMFKDFINKDNFMNTDNIGYETPRITGDVYIDTEVDEAYARNTLQEFFPDVNFHFSSVVKAYSARFIIYDEETELYTTVGTQKISTDDIDIKWFDNPYNEYVAEKDNYDFHGWSTTPRQEDVIESEDWLSKRSEIYDQEIYDYTFYAIFTVHQWNMRFFTLPTDSSPYATYKVTHGEKLHDLETYPIHPNEDELPLEERYRFLGWTLDRKVTIVTKPSDAKLVVLPNTWATKDYDFYAVFIRESVYASAMDESFFKIDSLGRLSVANGKQLSGKITVPLTVNGIKVTSISSEDASAEYHGFNKQINITHIFWEDNDRGEGIVSFGSRAFNECKQLKHISIPVGLTTIGSEAFYLCNKLLYSPFPETLQSIGQQAYRVAYAPQIIDSFVIPGSVVTLGQSVFTYIMNDGGGSVGVLQFGTPTNPCKLNQVDSLDIFDSNYNYFTNVKVYQQSGHSFPSQVQQLFSNLGADFIEV